MNKSIFILTLFAFAACTPNSTTTESTGSDMDSTSVSTEETNVDAKEGVFFGNIEDGATITCPYVMEMGVNGMQVEPKGQPREGYGHHHLNVNDGPTPEGIVIVADSTHIHYGGGQTSDTLKLEPGEYQLTLQFGDGMHVSYGEKWSKTIHVTVE